MASPEMVRIAFRFHANFKYPQLSREFYELVKAKATSQEGMEPEDRTALILSKKGDYSWTPEMPETRFVLGRRAQEYFKAKGHSLIQFYDLISDSEKDAVVNQPVRNPWLSSQ
jgi:hypothetical protein